MAKTSVFEPLFDDGLTSINFFNGRLLSAEDLKTERKANREGHRRLGEAIGDGVVYGFEVRKSDASTGEAPAVTVTAGLAINRSGDAIRLAQPTEVLLRTAQAASGTEIVKIFKDCVPARAGVYVPASGLYVLTVRPIRGGKGLAPVSGLGNALAECNLRYVVEGVEFQMLPLPMERFTGDMVRLRNRAAYDCFAVDAPEARPTSAFAMPTDTTVLADLRRTQSLTDCDIPLALIHWTGQGLEFVDQWSVRRRAGRPSSVKSSWTASIEGSASITAEARLRQFQTHIEALRVALPQASQAVATTHFKYLPPAGVLPITGVRTDERWVRPANLTTSPAFDYERFFGNHVRSAPVFIEGPRVDALIQESLAFPPIDLESEEMFRLYVVRVNVQAPPPAALPYMLFASGHMRWYGDARFDLARWNFSNYA